MTNAKTARIAEADWGLSLIARNANLSGLTSAWAALNNRGVSASTSLSCSRITSEICFSTVYRGLRAVIGSWNIMLISFPRTHRMNF